MLEGPQPGGLVAGAAAPGREALAVALVVGLVLLVAWVPTIRSEVAWYDSAEMVVAARRLDVPHQPGYPAYTLAGHLFLSATEPLQGWAPAWSPAARLSLMSALAAALGCGALAGLLRRRARFPAGAAVVGPLLLGLGPVVWGCAIVCEVYSVELLLLVLAAGAVSRALARGPGDRRAALLAGLCVGLAAAHRPSALALGLAALALAGAARARAWLTRAALPSLGLAAVGGALAFSPYAFLFARLGSPDLVVADPATPQSFATLWAYLTCADYRHALLVFGPAELLTRARHLAACLAGQAPWPALVVLALGVRWLAAERPRVGLACLVAAAVNSGFVVSYNAMEADTMLVPTLMAMAVAWSAGAADFLARLSSGGTARRALGVAFLVSLVGWAAVAGRTGLDTSRLEGALSFSRRVLEVVPRGGKVVVSDDVDLRPFLYGRFVLGERPDVGLVVVDKLDELNRPDLARAVRTTGLFGAFLHPQNLYPELRAAFYLRPLGSVYLALPAAPDFRAPPGAKAAWSLDLGFGGQVRLVGWDVGVVPGGSPRPGASLLLRFLWQCDAAPPAPLLAFVLFADSSGDLHTVSGAVVFHDVHRPCHGYLDTDRWRAGERYWDEQLVVIPEDLPPGTWDVWCGLVRADDPALPSLQLSELEGVNYLNYDGYEQVFRLCYGQRVGEPLWRLARLGDLERSGAGLLTVAPGGARLARLGEVVIAPPARGPAAPHR